jgi:hypothetical protein
MTGERRASRQAAARLAAQRHPPGGKLPPRPERKQGPLDAAELVALWEVGLGAATRRRLARAWGLEEQADGAQVFEAMAAGLATLDGLGRGEQGALEALAAQGGRARGELLRKELLWMGLGDCTGALRALVQEGRVVALPTPTESAAELIALDGQELLPRELAIPGAWVAALTGPDAPRAALIAQQAPEIVRQGAGERLVWNMMHLMAALVREPLRLNRSGVPHRRALTRAAAGILPPLEPVAPEDPPQDDYIAFLLALLQALGLLVHKDGWLVAQPREAERLFTGGEEALWVALGAALCEVSCWDELSSQQHARGLKTEATARHLSQTEATGQALIGARGYVMSVLKRARLEGWVALEAVLDLCEQLDRDYLPRVMKRVGQASSPREFIRLFLLGPMVWTGALEVGMGADGATLLRFTPRGVAMVGMERMPQQAPPAAMGGKCLIAQPNQEVMVFLDGAGPLVLWRMYQLGWRTGLADRVATFTLTAESVQRGYSNGVSAKAALAFLDEASLMPVDATLRFQLEDWERRWRRITVYADGTLLRHEDADQLDLVLDQLKHGGDGLEVMRLGPTSAYLFGALPDQASRIFAMERGVVIDYLGAPPPCLHFVEGMELWHHPLLIDLQSRAELERWCTPIPERTNTQRVSWSLDLVRVRERWPDDPLGELLAFLRPRAVGGLPAEQELFLRSKLLPPPRAQLTDEVLVLVFEEEAVASLFAALPQVAPHVVLRPGGAALCVAARARGAVMEALGRTGIKLRSDTKR